MSNLMLDFDEEILLEKTGNIIRYSGNDNELQIDEFYLTNRRIVYVYKQKVEGIIFPKFKTVVEKIPLNNIKVINGVVQATQIKDFIHGRTLQIVYTNRIKEIFKLGVSKKEYAKWEHAISVGVLDANFSTDNPYTQSNQNESFSSCNQENASYVHSFCTVCGVKLDEDVKFCSNCGTPVKNTNTGYTNTENKNTYKSESYTKRKTTYEGEVYKCPNCGETLPSFTVKCPACGYEIRGTKSVSSVKEFAEKLQRIESQKAPVFREKDSWMKSVFGRDLKENDPAKDTADRWEKQKKQEIATLIINFSIPNTKEDILEFMLLASSNIDIKCDINDEVTKAWTMKLKQIYEKSKLLMAGDSDFDKIKMIYDKKRKEILFIKFKVFLLTAGIVIGIIFLWGLLVSPVITIVFSILIVAVIIGIIILYNKKK